ncbi:MAG: SDR family oxidoreductase [Bacteroidia bacterium]|nr:SDR family oxidoreductase [Bacteroidia bacterium]
MNITLFGKNALVGGSTRGIGKAIAIELAALGANVTLIARNENKLVETLSQLRSTPTQFHDYLVADFSNCESLKAALSESTKKYHILVNNTGGPPGGPIVQAQETDFKSAFESHLLCNHLLVQHVIAGMKADNYGRIINIISTSVKQPIPGLGVSNTIRAAVANWSKTLSLELAPFGITVNNVLPGATDTDRIAEILENRSSKTGKSIDELREEMLHEVPMKRFASPSETAAAVAFLASPSAAYITGINLPVDGGRTACL